MAALFRVRFEDTFFPDREVLPFRGLMPYRQEDHALFGGRDKFIADALAKLREQGCVLVTGGSGTGKSSLCLAGIVPRVLKQDRSSVLIGFRPGQVAVDALAGALASALSPEKDLSAAATARAGLRTALARDRMSLSDLLAEARERRLGCSFLLYVDQGEELVTQAGDAPALLGLLESALAQHPGHLRLLMSARLDKTDELLDLDGTFFGRFDGAQIVLRRMNNLELHDALMRPIRETGIPCDPALIDLLIRDAQHQSGYLSHLQFVLKELWDADGVPARERLTPARYLAADGLSGAIARHAQNVYTALSEEEQRLAQEILPRLVVPNDQERDLALHVPLDQFSERAQALLYRLSDRDTRIVSIDGSGQVTFTHEEVIRQWEDLQRWIAERRERDAMLRALEDALLAWRQSGEEREFLLPGGRRLRAYRRLVHDLPEDARPVDAERFLRASRHAHAFFGPLALRAAAAALALLVGGTGIGIWLNEAEQRAEAIRVERRAEIEREIADKIATKDFDTRYDRRLFFLPSENADTDATGVDYSRTESVETDAVHEENYGLISAGFYAGERDTPLIEEYLGLCPDVDWIDLRSLKAQTIDFRKLTEACAVTAINYGNFDFSIMSDAYFPEGMSIRRSSFVGATLKGARFNDAILSNTNFACADIRGSDFSRAQDLDWASIAEATCRYPGPVPRLPDNSVPKGCQWLDQPEKEQERGRAEALVQYFRCIDREAGFTASDRAFQHLLVEEYDAAFAAISEGKRRDPANQYLALREAHGLILTGRAAEAAALYAAALPAQERRIGTIATRAIIDFGYLDDEDLLVEGMQPWLDHALFFRRPGMSVTSEEAHPKSNLRFREPE